MGCEEGTGGAGGHDDGGGVAAGDGHLDGQGKQLLSVGTVNLLVFIVFLHAAVQTNLRVAMMLSVCWVGHNWPVAAAYLEDGGHQQGNQHR